MIVVRINNKKDLEETLSDYRSNITNGKIKLLLEPNAISSLDEEDFVYFIKHEENRKVLLTNPSTPKNIIEKIISSTYNYELNRLLPTLISNPKVNSSAIVSIVNKSISEEKLPGSSYLEVETFSTLTKHDGISLSGIKTIVNNLLSKLNKLVTEDIPRFEGEDEYEHIVRKKENRAYKTKHFINILEKFVINDRTSNEVIPIIINNKTIQEVFKFKSQFVEYEGSSILRNFIELILRNKKINRQVLSEILFWDFFDTSFHEEVKLKIAKHPKADEKLLKIIVKTSTPPVILEVLSNPNASENVKKTLTANQQNLIKEYKAQKNRAKKEEEERVKLNKKRVRNKDISANIESVFEVIKWVFAGACVISVLTGGSGEGVFLGIVGLFIIIPVGFAILKFIKNIILRMYK